MTETAHEIQSSYQNSKAAFYRDPSVAYLEPFPMFGPLYYVGDKRVCIHLLDTGEGLLLIDSGYPHAIHMLTEGIFRLGFDPRNIRWILHTHGHFDHFGASNEYRRLYGCKLAISRAEAALLRENPNVALLGSSRTCTPMAYIPDFDIELADGQDFVAGGVKIHCVAIPGHTPGAMAFFFDLTQGTQTCRAGLFGGAGLGSLKGAVLRELGLPMQLQQDMLESIEKVRGERVDIMLGNHPGHNDTLARRARQIAQGGNPFLDPAAWDVFLGQCRDRFQEMFQREREEAAED